MNAASSSFLSLARKWRPQTFSELVGHDYTARVLQNAARDSRLHHAFLFTGTRGVGKTTLARIVAKMANCPHAEDGKPCLKCEICEQITAGRMLDVIELDAASHTKVEEMRNLLEGANYPPVQGKYKIFIIDEAHMLSKSAFAAMLKTLEEPPDYLKFVLATTDPQKLPATILSRCLCFALRPLERAQIAARLSEVLRAEGREFDDAAVNAVARLARGSMRDGLSILEQALAHHDGRLEAESVRRITGDIDAGILADILRAIAAGDAGAVPSFAARLRDDGAGYDTALAHLATLFYKIALFRAAPDAAAESAEERKMIESLAPLYDENETQLMYEIAVRGRTQLPFAPDAQTGFEMTVLRMIRFAPRTAEGDFSAPPNPAEKNIKDETAKSAPIAKSAENGAINSAANEIANKTANKIVNETANETAEFAAEKNAESAINGNAKNTAAAKNNAVNAAKNNATNGANEIEIANETVNKIANKIVNETAKFAAEKNAESAINGNAKNTAAAAKSATNGANEIEIANETVNEIENKTVNETAKIAINGGAINGVSLAQKWREMRDKLHGTARALADMCIPVELSGDGIILRADKSQKHNRKTMLPELEKQLRENFHPQFSVLVQDGEDEAAAAARKKELYAAATGAPFVRELLAIAPEAALVPDSIQVYHPETPHERQYDES